MNQLVDPVYLALKAACASALAVLLTRMLGGNDLLSAGFVALVCTSPSAHAGLRGGLQESLGSLLGGLIVGLTQALAPRWIGHPGALALNMALALSLCFRLGLRTGHLVTGFTVIYFHVLPFPSFGAGLWTRMLAVGAGILSATLTNATVAAFQSPRIVERRLRLAREAVAAELERLARCLEETATPWPHFEGAFAAVSELRNDLRATASERLFPGAARARRSARATMPQAIALEDTAHLGKELTLLHERGVDHPGELRPWLLQLGQALRTGGLADAPPPTPDPVLASVLLRLHETSREASSLPPAAS
jgi:uncharacterized membrane protein YccC